MSILFYDDSPVFGGHEVMSLAGVESVLDVTSGTVDVMVSDANRVLFERVNQLSAAHANLRVHTVPWCSSKLEALRNRLHPARARDLKSRFQKLAPSLVIAIQGNIEHSSLALHAARSAEIPSASYIPVPHSNSAMGAKLGAFRDVFADPLFQLPDSYITISHEMAALLRKRGAVSPIQVVYNGVDTTRFHPGDSHAARAALGMPREKTLLGVIGRMEFRQKRQQLLVHALASDAALKSSIHLIFVGEGPDRRALGALTSELGVSATLLPWGDPALVYQALDALVIPSRYEGLPLVMLEALASGTPVIGSDRDGMRDLLSPEYRFRPGDPAALAAALRRFLAAGKPPAAPALVARVRETMSLPAFRKSFAGAVLALTTPDSHLQGKLQSSHN